MADRSVKVAIRSELKSGFGNLAAQLKGLQTSLAEIKNLQDSINRLAGAFEKNNGLRNAAAQAKQAATSLKQTAQAQSQVNDQVASGIALAKRYESEQSKLTRSVSQLRAAQKAGSISNQQALQAETRLLQDYVKKTNDIGILSRKVRGPNGQFLSFSSGAKSPLEAAYAAMQNTVNTVGPRLVTKINDQAGRIREAVANIQYGLNRPASSGKARTELQAIYDNLFQAVENQAPRLVTKIKDQNGRIKEAIANIQYGLARPVATGANRKSMQSSYDSLFGAFDPNADAKRAEIAIRGFSRVIDAIPSIEKKLGLTPTIKGLQRIADAIGLINKRLNGPAPKPIKLPTISGGGVGGNMPSILKMFTNLGHMLFQIQYSLLTIAAWTGIAAIARTTDDFINLNNQIARTSNNIFDLSVNMKDVFDIANSTFSDVNGIGRIFSTIDKYSEQLKLAREDVVNVTRSIAGAFAASPGNAQEKNQARYQFIQAIQSNRLGGDELRAILEEAPGVGDVLSRGLSRVRGLPAGQVVNLRDSTHPPTAEEIIKAFNLPEIRAEIETLLKNSARTFGDGFQILKTRAVELAGEFEHSTGLMSGVITAFVSLVSDDTKWNNFIKSIEIATISLLSFAAVAAGRGAVNGVVGFARTQAPLIGDAMIASGIAARSASPRLLPGMANPFAAQQAVQAEAALARVAGPLRGIVGAAGAGGLALTRFLGIWALVITGVIALATAAINLNEKLGQLYGGMTILDALGAKFEELGILFDNLMHNMFFKTMVAAFDPMITLQDLFNGLIGILDNLGIHVDSLMSGLAKWLGNDDNAKQRQEARMFGRNGHLPTVMTGMGPRQVRVARDADGNVIYDEKGNAKIDRYVMGNPKTVNAVIADPRDLVETNAAGALAPFGRGLISGQKSNLPTPKAPHTGKTAAQRMADRVEEFFRDTILQINKINDDMSVPDQVLAIQAQLDENTKKLLDILNLKTVADLPEAIRRRLADVQVKLESANLAKAMHDLMRTLSDSLLGLNFDAFKQSLPELQAQIVDAQKQALETILNQGGGWDMDKLRRSIPSGAPGSADGSTVSELVVNSSLSDTVRRHLSRGDINSAAAAMSIYQTPEGQDATKAQLSGISSAITGGNSNSLAKSNDAAQRQLDIFKKGLSYFGSERDLQLELLNAREKYIVLAGNELALHPEILAAMEKELAIIKEQDAARTAYEANYRNGIQEALAAYKDGLDNLAGDTNKVFTNALSGLEDAFVNFITTGKLSLGDLLRSVAADITRLFVRQLIMKPLTNWISKMFGFGGGEDKVIQANVVYLNAATLIGGGMGGSSLGGSLASAAAGAVGGGGGGIGGFLGSMFTSIIGSIFHEGGVAGQATSTRLVNPSVFRSAMRYHTGGVAGMNALGVNEIPAILKRGERVLTMPQQMALRGGGHSQQTVFAPSVALTYNAGNGTNTSKEDAKKMAAMVTASIQEQIEEYDRKQRTPGHYGHTLNRH